MLVLGVNVLYFLLCFGCPFGTDYCYLWCAWAPFFLSRAPFLGLGGALGPLGLQGAHSRAKKGCFQILPPAKVSANLDPKLLIFQTFSACCFWCSSKVGFGHPFWAQGLPKWCQRLLPEAKEGANRCILVQVLEHFLGFLGEGWK